MRSATMTMSKRRALVPVLVTVWLLATVFLLGPKARAQGSAFDLDGQTRMLAPIKHKQLAVFPVVVRPRIKIDRTKYLTLAAGLERKLVKVSEQQGGARVNRVSVENRSQQPLLLLGGEIILGGKQDRVLGKDTIVPAQAKVTVETFCVEHGRWSGQRAFTEAGGLAEAKVRVRAKFRGSQQQVWGHVSKKNKSLGAQNATDTYRHVASGKAGKRAIKPYRSHIAAALDSHPEANRMVGLISAINGRITSVDIFANPSLFNAYRDRLLDSIILSAVDVPVDAKAKAATGKDVRQFMDAAKAAPAKEVARQRTSRTVHKRAKGVVNSEVRTNKPNAQPVYQSFQADE